MAYDERMVTTVYNDYVSIEDAETKLPKIRALLENARQLKREFETIAATARAFPEEKQRLQPIAWQLSTIIEELEDLGCYIKDLDIGLVDFLSAFEGRDIFLCWKLGEQRITHWHELHEGFSQRQEILDMTQLETELEFVTPVVENEN